MIMSQQAQQVMDLPVTPSPAEFSNNLPYNGGFGYSLPRNAHPPQTDANTPGIFDTLSPGNADNNMLRPDGFLATGASVFNYAYESAPYNNNNNPSPNGPANNGGMNHLPRQRNNRLVLPTGWSDNSAFGMNHAHPPFPRPMNQQQLHQHPQLPLPMQQPHQMHHPPQQPHASQQPQQKLSTTQQQQTPHPSNHLGNLNHHGNMWLDPNQMTPASHTPDQFRSNSSLSDAEQLIPTAIVIKNIPFAVRREQLAQIMNDLQLPQPYAFNYHFDNGVFRGLAFANFQNAEDTRIVIECMNGYEVAGRKLRVEYKKMLPEAERERIEREKRERRGQLEEQHRGGAVHPHNVRNIPPIPLRGISLIPNVDFNDPDVLNYFVELKFFEWDQSREALIFPATITPEQRRQIHIMAHHMGFIHKSVGQDENRQLQIIKQPLSPPSAAHISPGGLDVQRRGLYRAATFDFPTDRETRSTSASYTPITQRPGPMIEFPTAEPANAVGNAPNNLRAAKSFADLRSVSPTPSASPGYLSAALNGLGGFPGNFGRMNEFSVPPGSANNNNNNNNNYNGPSGSLTMPTTAPTPSSPVPSPHDGALGVLSTKLGGLGLSPFENNDGSPLLQQQQQQQQHLQQQQQQQNQQQQQQQQQQRRRGTPIGVIGSQRPSTGGGSIHRPSIPERQPKGPEWENDNGFHPNQNNGLASGPGQYFRGWPLSAGAVNHELGSPERASPDKVKPELPQNGEEKSSVGSPFS